MNLFLRDPVGAEGPGGCTEGTQPRCSLVLWPWPQALCREQPGQQSQVILSRGGRRSMEKEMSRPSVVGRKYPKDVHVLNSEAYGHDASCGRKDSAVGSVKDPELSHLVIWGTGTHERWQEGQNQREPGRHAAGSGTGGGRRLPRASGGASLLLLDFGLQTERVYALSKLLGIPAAGPMSSGRGRDFRSALGDCREALRPTLGCQLLVPGLRQNVQVQGRQPASARRLPGRGAGLLPQGHLPGRRPPPLGPAGQLKVRSARSLISWAALNTELSK